MCLLNTPLSPEPLPGPNFPFVKAGDSCPGADSKRVRVTFGEPVRRQVGEEKPQDSPQADGGKGGTQELGLGV